MKWSHLRGGDKLAGEGIRKGQDTLGCADSLNQELRAGEVSMGRSDMGLCLGWCMSL